jgi:broad specificity phosphatase PhoE
VTQEEREARSRENVPFELALVRHGDKPLRIALVGHGGTNSVILSHLLGVAPVPWEWLRFETALAAISTVALRPVSDEAYVWSLQRFGWRED